jgi:hypothetical protein
MQMDRKVDEVTRHGAWVVHDCVMPQHREQRQPHEWEEERQSLTPEE